MSPASSLDDAYEDARAGDEEFRERNQSKSTKSGIDDFKLLFPLYLVLDYLKQSHL